MTNLLHKMTILQDKLTNLQDKLTNLLHKMTNLLHKITIKICVLIFLCAGKWQNSLQYCDHEKSAKAKWRAQLFAFALTTTLTMNNLLFFHAQESDSIAYCVSCSIKGYPLPCLRQQCEDYPHNDNQQYSSHYCILLWIQYFVLLPGNWFATRSLIQLFRW